MQIRKLFILLFLSLSTFVMGQVRMNNLIEDIPFEILPGMNKELLGELSLGHGQEDTLKVKNIFTGTTCIDSISNDFVKIISSDVVETQIRLLFFKDSTYIISVVKTFNEPVKESTISFYSKTWKPLEDNFMLPNINKPEELLEDFIFQPDTMKTQRFLELTKYIEPVIINADFSKQNVLSLNLSIPLMPSDEIDSLKTILRKKEFLWDGKNFMPL